LYTTNDEPREPHENDDLSIYSSVSFSCCQTDDGGVPLDITLRKFLRHKHGFFIESGANDGISQSNTYFFAKHRGWKGLLVEPAAAHLTVLKRDRPESTIVQAALVAAEDDGKPLQGSLQNEGSLMAKISSSSSSSSSYAGSTSSSIVGRSLSSILDEHYSNNNSSSSSSSSSGSSPKLIIDIWSLDVEGFEVQALRGLDFSRHRPRFILIEVWENNKADVFQYMNTQRYVLLPGIDHEGSQSGWKHHTAHRDFLWYDADQLQLQLLAK
jgi:hypothetical protein